MPSSYSRNLGLELISTGEQPGTWGETTNINFQALDDAINGVQTIPVGPGGANVVVDNAPSMSDGRAKVLIFSDSGVPPGGATVTFAPNDDERYYFCRNETAGPLTFSQGSGSTYVLAAGYSAVVHANGMGSGASVFGTLSSIQANKLLVRADANIPGADGSVMIEGAATVKGTMNITGAVTLTGAISADSMTLAAALSVGGPSTLTGAVTAQSTLDVTGAVTMKSTLKVTGAIDCASVNAVGAVAAGSLSSLYSATVGGTLGVGGKTTLAGGLDLYVDGSDTAYDMYYRSAAAAPNTAVARLPIGAAGLYLRATAAGPAWQALSMPAGTPVTGFNNGDILYSWGNVLTRGYIHTDAGGTLLALSGPGAYGGQFWLDSVDPNATILMRFIQGGKTRWDFGCRNIGSMKGAWTIASYAYNAADDALLGTLARFEVQRETGHICIGYNDTTNFGGVVNIQAMNVGPFHSTNDTPLVIRRQGGSTAPLLVFQNNAGGTMTYFDSNGLYQSGGPTGAWISLPRTASHYALTGVTGGALFFFHPTPADTNTAGGFLSFGYGIGGGFYGTFYAALPTANSGIQTNLMWAYHGNSQPPRVSFEEHQDMCLDGLVSQIIARPALVARLKEAIAAA